MSAATVDPQKKRKLKKLYEAAVVSHARNYLTATLQEAKSDLKGFHSQVMQVAPKEAQKALQHTYGRSPSASLDNSPTSKKDSLRLDAEKEAKKAQKLREQGALILEGKRKRRPNRAYCGSDSGEDQSNHTGHNRTKPGQPSSASGLGLKSKRNGKLAGKKQKLIGSANRIARSSTGKIDHQRH